MLNPKNVQSDLGELMRPPPPLPPPPTLDGMLVYGSLFGLKSKLPGQSLIIPRPKKNK